MKSIFVEFKETLLRHGLEYFGRFYGLYRGSVYDNKDPEQLGRVRILCPQVFGGKSPNKWVFQRGAMAGKKSGGFFPVQDGDPIYISFINGDKNEPIWERGWWLQDAVPEPARRANPNMHLYHTPGGLTLEMDDEADTFTISNKGGYFIKLHPDGIEISDGSGETLQKIIADLAEQTAAVQVIVAGMASGPQVVNAAQIQAIIQRINNFLQ